MRSCIDQLVESMMRTRRGLYVVLISFTDGVKDCESIIPIVARLIAITLDAAGTIGGIELEVVCILDGNHVAVSCSWKVY